MRTNAELMERANYTGSKLIANGRDMLGER